MCKNDFNNWIDLLIMGNLIELIILITFFLKRSNFEYNIYGGNFR